MKTVTKFLIIALATATLAACKKDNSEGMDELPDIEIINSEALNQTVYADQTEAAAVNFTATGDWNSYIAEIPATKADAPTWISIAPASGKAGDNSLAITVEENFSGADRAAKITITSGNEQKDVILTQKATTQDGNPYEKKYDIYAFAWYSNDKLSFNTQQGSELYWKNGEANETPFYVTDMKVVGNNVYAVGYQFISNTTNECHAIYWKNGQAIRLPETLIGNVATAIDVVTTLSGVDVYIAGYEHTSYNHTYQAKYWKSENGGNFVSYLLGHGSNVDSRATFIDYCDGNLYVAGDLEYGYKVTYWKNGVMSDLHDYGSVLGMCATSSNIYMCGYEMESFAVNSLGYWKNSQRIQPLSPHNNGFVYDITVSGNDVYMVGVEGAPLGDSRGFVWKNGEAVFTSRESGNAQFPKGIQVVDGDIFIFYPNGYYSKNGQLMRVPNYSGGLYGTHCIAVPHSPTRTW
jgi:hypothetical protein